MYICLYLSYMCHNCGIKYFFEISDLCSWKINEFLRSLPATCSARPKLQVSHVALMPFIKKIDLVFRAVIIAIDVKIYWRRFYMIEVPSLTVERLFIFISSQGVIHLAVRPSFVNVIAWRLIQIPLSKCQFTPDLLNKIGQGFRNGPWMMKWSPVWINWCRPQCHLGADTFIPSSTKLLTRVVVLCNQLKGINLNIPFYIIQAYNIYRFYEFRIMLLPSVKLHNRQTFAGTFDLHGLIFISWDRLLWFACRSIEVDIR